MVGIRPPFDVERCEMEAPAAPREAHHAARFERASRGRIIATMRDDFWLSEDERQTRELARTIARQRVAPLAAQVDEAEIYPADSLQHLAQAGLMGLYIPEAYGGAGLG